MRPPRFRGSDALSSGSALRNVVSSNPAAGALAEHVPLITLATSRFDAREKNLHRDGCQGAGDGDTADSEEAVPYTLDDNPVVDVEGHAESEHVLDKVHGSECLAGLLTMAIDNVCDDACGTELHAEIDETHADDDWNGPWLLSVGGLAPTELRGC